MDDAARVLPDTAQEATVSRDADLRQAEYFQRLLSEMRLDANTQLARLSIDLQRALNAGQNGRAAELRRLIRALLSEMRTLDTLGEALAERLGAAPVVCG